MDIQVGDRVTYKYFDKFSGQMIKKVTIIVENGISFSENTEILKIERPNWEVVEEKKDLLTEEEREFLKLVLKFMNTEIKYIRKKINWNGKLEILFCENEDGSGAWYCYYLKEGYFKNLEVGKGYTLSELGLEE